MAELSTVVGTRLAMEAVVGDANDSYDIVSYSAAFELNTIPSGSVMLPVGYVLGTGVPAEIMTKFNKFTAKQKIQIYLTVSNPAGDYGTGFGSFQDGVRKLIFDGYITGAILRRTDKSLHIVAHFVHWLADLNNSSVFSGTSNVANPSVFYDEGAATVYTGTGTGSPPGDTGDPCGFSTTQDGHWSILSTSTDLLSGSSDVWDDGLKPFLTCLVSQDSLDPALQKYFNSQAAIAKRKDALSKIKSVGLKLDPNFKDPAISENMTDGINNGLRDVDANNTIWGLLISRWGPDFFFAMCPRVEDVLVAPLVGSLRNRDPNDNYATIQAGDYYAIDLNLSTRQSVGAVGMIAANTNTTGVASLLEDIPEWPGFFPRLPEGAAAQKYDGVFLARNMPFWLANVIFEPPPLDPATFPVTAFVPGIGAAADIVAGVVTALRAAELQKLQRNLADQFAQFFYVNEIFNNRSGDISGKLRFDICPGSTCKVQVLAIDQTKSTGFDHFYGQVVRVSYTIDATQGVASTVFTMSNLRTEAELKDQNYSIDKPPLYEAAWAGASLL